MNMRQMFPAMLCGLLLFAGCRQDMHDQPRFKPLSKSDFYTDLRSSRPLVEGTVARGCLSLHRDDGKQRYSWRLHAVSSDTRSAGAGPRAIQHLLHALPLTPGRREGHCPLAGIRQDATIVPHRAAAEGASRLLLRCDHPWFRGHARLFSSDKPSRSLGDCRLHTRSAAESERRFQRYTCWSANTLARAQAAR
jgi:hypothetical protein